jgi:hypothetical protein
MCGRREAVRECRADAAGHVFWPPGPGLVNLPLTQLGRQG